MLIVIYQYLREALLVCSFNSDGQYQSLYAWDGQTARVARFFVSSHKTVGQRPQPAMFNIMKYYTLILSLLIVLNIHGQLPANHTDLHDNLMLRQEHIDSLCTSIRDYSDTTLVSQVSSTTENTIIPIDVSNLPIKSYSGTMDYMGLSGSGLYHYCLYNEERVWHGTFYFKSKELEVKGNYKNGVLDGKYTQRILLGKNVSFSTIYKMGKINGSISITYIRECYPKLGQSVKSTFIWSATNNKFKNGSVAIKVTKFDSKTKSVLRSITVTGNFDKDGMLDGEWTVPSIYDKRYCDHYVFDNGMLKLYKRYDDSTGKSRIIYEYIEPKEPSDGKYYKITYSAPTEYDPIGYILPTSFIPIEYIKPIQQVNFMRKF